MRFFRTCLSSRRYRRKSARYRARVKMDRSRPNWLDLPQGIVELIINKLHFPDQIRTLAVCKSWRACKDYVRSSERIPWAISYQRISDIDSEEHSFVCELFDPCTQKVHKVSNSIEFSTDTISAYASKYGWFLHDGMNSYKLFLHNPFTNEIISLPLEMGADMPVTMKGSPTSPDCEIFSLSVDDYFLFIDSGCLSKKVARHFESIVEMNEYESFYSILYMKGNIYCLFESGKLNRYGLEDKSWELLTSEFPEPYKSWFSQRDAWLMEINENLIMVAMDIEGKRCNWMIFRFDWSAMSWVAETGLKSCAIYISGNLAFSAPLADRNEKRLEGCRVFYHNKFVEVAGGRGIKCFSLSGEGGSRRIKSKEYGWIERSDQYDLSFIQPPYFGI